MKTQNGFTLMNKNEIPSYLAKQKVTRKITRLQVHNTFLPDYTTWEKTDKKVFSEPHFGRAQSLDDYGKKTWGYSDGHGHYTAQNFTVFPDGKIIVSRNLNSKPIGIKGWNDGALCIEIYGNFDKGKDVMTTAQKNAVIALYGELCKRFKISVDTAHIRPHCWFTARGTYLGKYDSSRSAKTCPGTNFMGHGCSPSGFAKFINDIKDYINGKKDEPKDEDTSKYTTGVYRIDTDDLNVREKATADSEKVGVVHKGDAYTITKVDGNWGYLKSGLGWIHLGYCKKYKIIVKRDKFS